MNWIRPLYTLYQRLLKVGVTDELSFAEKLRTELSNQFIIVAFPSAIFHLIYNFLTLNSYRGYVLVALWTCILSFTLLLNYSKRYITARFFISIFSLFLIALCHVLFGWEQRFEFMYLLFILISCYLLERKFAIVMIALILLTYTAVATYLTFYGPIFQIQIIGSGTSAYFTFAIIITITLTAKMLRENYKYNQIVIQQNKVLE